MSFAGREPGKLAQALLEKHKIIVTTMVENEFSGIRVSPGVSTTLAEVDALCEAVEKELAG